MFGARSAALKALLCTCLLALVFLLPIAQKDPQISAQEPTPQTDAQRQALVELNRSVEAFKSGRTDDAVEYFQRAKQLDPQMVKARLYLATSYASLYIPGAPSEENRKKGEAAIAEFRGALDVQPENLSAIDGIGSLLYNMAGTPFDREMFEQSKSFHRRHSEINPQDPEPYYWVGVIDWTLAWRANSLYRAQYNLKTRGRELAESDPLPPEVRYEYAHEYEPIVEEGIESLQKAINLRPDYDDAMAYLNLLYRRKADMVETEHQRRQLEKMADDLIERVKEIKQKRAASEPQ